MNKMNYQIVFNIKYFFNDINREISTNNINELNNIITDLEVQFMSAVDDSILNKEIVKDEYISYINELGILVKGEVKNYKIQNELLEFIFKEGYLRHSAKEIHFPFYYKKITLKKYIVDDVIFLLKVNFNIESKIDKDV
jgi:hypothetical protein